VVRFLLLLVLFWVIARVFWRFVEGVARGASMPPPGGGRRGSAPSPVKMQPCPVCGTYVVPGKAISATSSSGPVHFCSEKCRSEFAAR
jgi:YHS domain-containing protein